MNYRDRRKFRRAIAEQMGKSSAEYLTRVGTAWFFLPPPMNFQVANQATEKYRDAVVGLGVCTLLAAAFGLI